MVPFLDLKSPYAELKPEIDAAMQRVLDAGWFILGPEVEAFERAFATYCQAQEAVSVANGLDALHLALLAMDVGPGDEVIVPALTFFATAGAVGALGAVPVVVDVLPGGGIDPRAAADAVTAATRAVVPVHLFGSRAPDCSDLGLPVLDDAAQAIGADPPASVGALTALSVYPTKVWGAAGDGGFVVGDAAAVEAVRRLGNHGQTSPGRFDRVEGWTGRNSRLDTLQAAILLGHAARLPERVGRRRDLAARYDARLPAWVRPMPRDAGCPVPVYAVRTDRARATAALDAAGIGWAVYYDRGVAAQAAIARRAPTPVADALADELLALPVHDGLTVEAVDRVCAVLERA